MKNMTFKNAFWDLLFPLTLTLTVTMFPLLIKAQDNPDNQDKTAEKQDSCKKNEEEVGQDYSGLVSPLEPSFPVSGQKREVLYNQMYPLHIKLCFSGHGQKMNPNGTKGDFIEGTHSFFYIKGVCQDKDAPIPLLKKCIKDVDITDPNAGVGVGVIEGLKNVNFTIIPSLDVLLGGYIKPGEKLTKEVYSDMAEKLVDTGIYDGVVWHDKFLPKDRKTGKKMQSDDRATKIIRAKLARGSDFAIALGRTVHCVNIPVNEDQLDKVVTYLNKMNRHYSGCHQGESESEAAQALPGQKKAEKEGLSFSYITNSCSHLTTNALAEIDLLKYSPYNRNLLVSLLSNVPVPSSSPLDVLMMANEGGLSFKDFLWAQYKRKKKGISTDQDLPSLNPGVVLSRFGVYKDNELFDPTEDRYLMSTAPYKSKYKKLPFHLLSMKSGDLFRNLSQEPEYSSLQEELLSVQAKLKKVQEGIAPWDNIFASIKREKALPTDKGGKATSEEERELTKKLKKYLSKYYKDGNDDGAIGQLIQDFDQYKAMVQSKLEKVEKDLARLAKTSLED